MIEIWKDIPEYEGIYQVSNLGRIKVLRFRNNICDIKKERLLTIQKNNRGYCKTILYKNGKYKNKLIHRLVAQVFLDDYNEKKEINHKDGNKENNCTNNLEVVNRSQNMKHAYSHKLNVPYALGKYGEKSLKSKKVNMLDKNTGEVIKTFGSLIDASHYLGIEKSCHIVSCCKGRLKTAYGYKWEYGINSAR